MADAASPSRPQRRRRRWLAGLAAVVILLLVFIAALPMLVTWGLGQGLIRNAINRSINGTATFTSLRTSWFGDQSLEGLRIVDTRGREAAHVQLTLRAGLWQIITQRPGRIDATISGTLTGEVREDGTISFLDLLPQAPPSPTSAPPSPRAPEPFRLPPDLPPLNLHLANVDLHLTNLRTQQTLQLNDLTGQIAYIGPTQPITASLRGVTLTDGVPGSIDITANADQIFAPDGTLALRGGRTEFRAELQSAPFPIPIPGVDSPMHVRTGVIHFASDDLTDRIVGSIEINAQIEGQPASYLLAQIALGRVLTTHGELSLRGGSINLSTQAQNLPFATADVTGFLQQLTATVVSNDLTQTTVIAIDGTAQLQGHESSVLSANLSAEQLFAPDGTLTFAPERITGTVQGSTIPSAVVQPFLSQTAIVLSRDAGPVLNVNASFSPGETKDISMAVTSAWAQLEVRAAASAAAGREQPLHGDHLLLSLQRAHPDLVRALTNLHTDRPTPLTIHLTSFALPPVDPQTDARPLRKYSATGTLNVPGPVALVLARGGSGDAGSADADADADAIAVEVQGFQARLESPALEQFLDLQGSGSLDGASAQLQFRITNLFDETPPHGAINLLQSTPIGGVQLTNLSAATLVKFAPAQRALIDEVIGPSLTATINTREVEQRLLATIDVRANTQRELALRLAVMRLPDALRVSAGEMTMTMTPELAAMLQEGDERPIVLMSVAQARFELQPFELPLDRTTPDAGPFAYRMPTSPVQLTVHVPAAALDNVPGLAEPVGLANVQSNVSYTARGEDWSAHITGDAQLRRASANQRVADLRFQTDVQRINAQTALDATVHATQLSIADLEPMLGREPGTVSQWVGGTGDGALNEPRAVSLTVTGRDGTYQGTLQPNLPHLAGDFAFTMDDEALTLTGRTTRLVLDRTMLEGRMNPPAPAGRAAAPAPAAPLPAGIVGAPREARRAANQNQNQSQNQARTDAGTIVQVPESVPLTLEIASLRVPRAILAGEPFDPRALAIEAHVQGGPMQIVSISEHARVHMTLRDMNLQLESRDIRQGVAIALRSRAEAEVTEFAPPPQPTPPPAATPVRPPDAVGAPPAPSPPPSPPGTRPAAPSDSGTPATPAPSGPRVGELDVSGRILDLVVASPDVHNLVTLQPANARVQLTARATDVPTAIADAIANMQGLLVAAVGSLMRATITADHFSLTSGQVDARIETEHGWLEAQVIGRDNALVIQNTADGRALQAELALTESLRDRLLSRIHPFLADIRTTEQPLRATISAASVPFTPEGSFNIAGLNADLQITIGAVEFDGGSTTIGLMRLAGQADRLRTVPGNIEPIIARIRNGIVTYERFTVSVERWSMTYSGQIDLVNGTVNLRTQLPLAALAHTFRELEGIADRITVPLITRGRIGEAVPQLDLSDVARQALPLGINRSLEELFRGGGGGGGGGGGRRKR